ncbi:MAG TPA: oligosaccharide flippase family protein, partial [Hyphomicrobiaceae bacterium]|nr:oligosaccharide flippase family protein [Hyphomicrobiaceae bacterium]
MLLRQTLLYLPAQLIGPLFLFVSIVAWTHWLPPHDLGTMTLILVTHELMHVVCVSWFSYYVVRYHSRASDADQRRRLIDSEATILALATVASVSASTLVLARVADGFASPALIVASIAFMATRSITLHLADRARAEDEVVSYTVIQIATSALGLLIGLGLAHVHEPTPLAAIGGLAAAQLLALIACLPRLRPRWNPVRPDASVLKAALAYGLPFIVSGPLIWASVNGLRYIVEFALGSAALGLVTVGWALGQRGASVAALVTTAAAFPLAVKRTREEGLARGAEQLASNAVLLTLLLAPAMGGLWVLGPQLTNAVVAEAYREATIAVIPLAALAGLVRNIRMHFSNQIFLLHERTDVALRIDAVDAAASLGLALIGLWL